MATKEVKQAPQSEKQGKPSNPARVDVTGIIPDNIRVDPNLTEGHPGYEESGDSEIIPAKCFAKDENAEKKGSG